MEPDTKAALSDAVAAMDAALSAVQSARDLWARDAGANKVGPSGFPIPDKLPLNPVAGRALLAELAKLGIK